MVWNQNIYPWSQMYYVPALVSDESPVSSPIVVDIKYCLWINEWNTEMGQMGPIIWKQIRVIQLESNLQKPEMFLFLLSSLYSMG